MFIENQKASISRQQMNRDLSSPLLWMAAIFFTAAVFFAVPGILQLFDTEKTGYLMIILSQKYYIDGGATISWVIVRALIHLLALLVPVVMAIGLWLSVAATRSKGETAMPLWGVNYFLRTVKTMKIILFATSGILALLFFVRVGRYIIINAPQTGGFLFIFAMLLPELVFAFIVTIVMLISIRGVTSLTHTLDNIQLIVLTGKADSYGLNGFSSVFLLLIGCASAALAFVLQEQFSAVLAFALSAAAHCLLAAWLWWYRRQIGHRSLTQYRSEKSQIPQ